MQSLSDPPKNNQAANPPRKRRRTGGSRFSWNPASFEAAKCDIDLARQRSGSRGAELARVMPHVIASMGERSQLGGLACPAPVNDPDGTYRVGIDADGRPEIQRLEEAGVWAPVVL